MRYIRVFFFIVASLSIAQDRIESIKKGNLALPISQQPTMLFGFGQTIVEKNDILAYGSIYPLIGKHKTYIDVFPDVIYGISDELTLYLSAPFTPKYQECNNKSSGIEDVFAQIEYLFFRRDQVDNSLWATVLAGIFVPTGSTKKDPRTGYGSPSFLLGSHLIYWSVDWYGALGASTLLTTRKDDTRYGDIFYYQAGLGRNIIGNPDGWIVTPVFEIIGSYNRKDYIRGALDCDSGGHVLYLGPTLFASTIRFIGHAGFLYAITQQLNGSQNKNKFLFGLSLGWKFNA